MQSTLTPTETDPHDIFVIEPDVVLAARADQTPAAPTVDTTFRATATTAAPAAGDIRAPEIEVPGDIHLLGKRPPRGRMARAILGFVFAIGAAAATAGASRTAAASGLPAAAATRCRPAAPVPATGAGRRSG